MVTLRDAREVTKAIVDQLDPQAVVLFGSMARNGVGEDLDVWQEAREIVNRVYGVCSVDPVESPDVKSGEQGYSTGLSVYRGNFILLIRSSAQQFLSWPISLKDSAIYRFGPGVCIAG